MTTDGDPRVDYAVVSFVSYDVRLVRYSVLCRVKYTPGMHKVFETERSGYVWFRRLHESIAGGGFATGRNRLCTAVQYILDGAVFHHHHFMSSTA